MKNHSPIHTIAFLAMLFGLGVFAPTANAQHFRGAYGYGVTPGHHSGGPVDALGRSVYALDQMADEMTWQFAYETRSHRGCPHAAALLKAMRIHSCNTEKLIEAYRGTCPHDFEKAACAAHDSLGIVQDRRKRVKVSPKVCELITQSCPVATYVHRNANRFRPIPIIPHGGCQDSGPSYRSHESPSRHRSHTHHHPRTPSPFEAITQLLFD